MLLPQGVNAEHSKTICISSPIAPLLQAKQSLLTLSIHFKYVQSSISTKADLFLKLQQFLMGFSIAFPFVI